MTRALKSEVMCAMCRNPLLVKNICPAICGWRHKTCKRFVREAEFSNEKTCVVLFVAVKACTSQACLASCVCGASVRVHARENYAVDLLFDVTSFCLGCRAQSNSESLFISENDKNSLKYQWNSYPCEHWSLTQTALPAPFHSFSVTRSTCLMQGRTVEVDSSLDEPARSDFVCSHIIPVLHNHLVKIQRLRRFYFVQSTHALESSAKLLCDSRTLFYVELKYHSPQVRQFLFILSKKSGRCVVSWFKMVDKTDCCFVLGVFHYSSAMNVSTHPPPPLCLISDHRSTESRANSCYLDSELRDSCEPIVLSEPSRRTISSSSNASHTDLPYLDELLSVSGPVDDAFSTANSPPSGKTTTIFVSANEGLEKPISSPNLNQSRNLDPRFETGVLATTPAALRVPSGQAFTANENGHRKLKRSVRPWFSVRATSEALLHRLAGLLLLLCPVIAVASAIKEPPRLTVPYPFEMLTVPRSDDRSLLCPIVGTPTPIFEWYKDSESIPDDAGWDRITVSESRLRIKDAHMEDSGRYVCTAVNGFGKLNYTFVVTVNDPLAPPSLHEDQGAPTLLQVYPQSPGPAVVKMAGQSVSFKCRVGGAPEPVVVWYKDGIPVTDDGSPALARSNDLHTLHIGRLHRTDAGLYTCTATNMYGPVTANWTLRVLAGSGGVSSSPSHTPPPLRVHNASVVEGEQEAVLTCEGASGSGDPHVKWLRARGSSSSVGGSIGDPFIEWRGREFAVLPPSSVGMKVPGLFVTELVIDQPEQEHAGEYVCMATTTEGTAVGTANLTVIPRGPGSILLVVMGLLGSIAVIAVVTAVVATYRRRRRQQRHVGAFKPAPAAGGYKGHPSSQASSNLLQADDCQRQPVGKNGMAGSVNGGPYPPRYVRPPGVVQGRVGDSGALLPNQDGMVARYQDPSSASVYLSGPQGHNDSSGGSDYKPPLTPLNDFQQQPQQQQPQYQQIAAPQQYHMPSQQQTQHQYQLPQQQHLLTSPQQCGMQQHPAPQQQPQQPQYQTTLPQQIPPQQFQYHQLDVI